MDRAAGAVELARPVLPVLRLLEQGQHRAEIPAGIAGIRPAVVVGPVTAAPEHGVDAARSAQHLAERQRERAMIDERTRFITVRPVVPRADVLDPLRRVRETLDIFNRPAGFEQEDGGVGTVQQATRDHAARGACADDHVVVISGERLTGLSLAMKFDQLPFVVLAWIWGGMFVVNMTLKEISMSRYPEWAEYKRRSWWLPGRRVDGVRRNA